MGVSFLDALEAAQALIALFLPFSDQSCVHPFFSYAIVVEFARDLMLFVVEVVDIATHLVMHLVDGPEYLRFALAFVGLIFDVPHLLL